MPATDLTLFLSSVFRFLPRERSLFQLCHSCTPPGMLGSPSLSVTLWDPLYGAFLLCIHLVSTPCGSLSYLLLFGSLPYLSPKLLIAYSSRPQNPQDFLLIDQYLQLLLHFLCQPLSFRTLQEHI